MSDPSEDKGATDWSLRTFGTFWICLVLAVNVVALIGVYLKERTFWAVIAAVQDWFGPHNMINFVFELILLAPAGLAYWLLDRRHRRRRGEA